MPTGCFGRREHRRDGERLSFADAGDVVLLQRTVANAPNGNADRLHLRQTLDIVKLVILISSWAQPGSRDGGGRRGRERVRECGWGRVRDVCAACRDVGTDVSLAHAVHERFMKFIQVRSQTLSRCALEFMNSRVHERSRSSSFTKIVS